MRPAHPLAVALIFLLSACQPPALPTVTIIDNDKILRLQTTNRDPSALLEEAEIHISPNDRVLLNGLPITLDQPISNFPITLQIRRAVPVTVSTPAGEQKLHSSALTVGEALQ